MGLGSFFGGLFAQAPSKNPTGPNVGFQSRIRGGAWSSVHTSGDQSYFLSVAKTADLSFACHRFSLRAAPGQPSVMGRVHHLKRPRACSDHQAIRQGDAQVRRTGLTRSKPRSGHCNSRGLRF